MARLIRVKSLRQSLKWLVDYVDYSALSFTIHLCSVV
jgi:hypothetical protein